MSAHSHPMPCRLRLENITRVFPRADLQIVLALAAQSQALPRYLAQIHEITLREAAETIEVFFDLSPTLAPSAVVA